MSESKTPMSQPSRPGNLVHWSARCGFCEQDMAQHVGCTLDTYDFTDGTTRPRIPYGDKREGWDQIGITPAEHCNDCGTPLGWLHHPLCDIEACPCCGRQAIACGCIRAT